jgi:hypothetical protein
MNSAKDLFGVDYFKKQLTDYKNSNKRKFHFEYKKVMQFDITPLNKEGAIIF